MPNKPRHALPAPFPLSNRSAWRCAAKTSAEAKLATGSKVGLLETPLDDSWARDIGPTFLRGPAGGRGAVRWQFNAWGNKYHPYDQDAALAARIASAADVRLYEAPLVCEGGAIHTDGEGTLLATEQCLLNANRNPQLTRQQVEERLAFYTGARRIIWLGSGFSDHETDGHIDNIACFRGAGPRACRRAGISVPSRLRTVLRRRSADCGRRATLKGRAIEIIEIEQPRVVRFGWQGHPLPASYVNFYLPNGGIVMPAFEDPNDEKARAVLADCFPGRDILQIDALDIVQGGGGIHCITQQEPARHETDHALPPRSSLAAGIRANIAKAKEMVRMRPPPKARMWCCCRSCSRRLISARTSWPNISGWRRRSKAIR